MLRTVTFDDTQFKLRAGVHAVPADLTPPGWRTPQ